MSGGKLIFSLDIGSSKITSLVGLLGERLEVLGLSNYNFVNNKLNNDFKMLGNGLICEVEKVGAKILQTLHEAQISADCSKGALIVNLAGGHIRNIYSHSRQEMNGSPVLEDTIRYMINEAREIIIPPNYEIVDFEIQEYLIDDDRYTVNPLNLNCQTINTNVNMMVAGKLPMTNLKKAISYSNFEVAKIVPSAILSAMAVLNNEERELGCCLIDIGAGTTDVIVYENGFIRHIASIPLGGEDITRDIATVLKVSRNLAEDLKLNYGNCGGVGSSRYNHEGISLTDHRGENTVISRKLLTDVIVERLKDIFGLVRTQLNNNDLCDIINSGIVVTGGSAQLGNLKEFVAQYFNMPARVGVPEYCGDFSDMVCNPRYATSLGALYYANEVLTQKSYHYDSDSGIAFGQVFKKIKNIFKNT